MDEFERALGVIDARQFDDDSIVAGFLHDRLGHAEFVDALTYDFERAVNRFGFVSDGLFRLVNFQFQVHTALEVEAQLERDALDRVVCENAVALHALDDSTRKERPRGSREKSHNERKAVLHVRHRCRWPGVEEDGVRNERTRHPVSTVAHPATSWARPR